MKIIKLTDEFYDTYKNCPEILDKRQRPYLLIKTEQKNYAIPFRSNIPKTYSFKIRKIAGKDRGLDFQKAVLLEKDSYFIDRYSIPKKEYYTVQKKSHLIKEKFEKTLSKYYSAKQSQNENKLKDFKYCTFQYFDLTSDQTDILDLTNDVELGLSR